MGLLRLWLALCVASSHSGPLFGLEMLRADLAVGSFFVLAGFLSAHVLETRYRGRYATFYMARALRLWPAYWTVLGLSAAFMLWTHFYGPARVGPMAHWRLVEKFPEQPWLSLFGLSQAFAVGQDLSWFAGLLPDGSLRWGCAPGTLLLLYSLNILPQAWTLAIEEYYYALAPWLGRLKFWGAAWATGLGIAVGLALAPFCARLPLAFFPTALPFFLAGVLSYRFFQSLQARAWAQAWQGRALALFTLGLLALPYGPFAQSLYAALLLMACGLPWVFRAFKDRAWDRGLGDLSYPLYLVHLPVYWACILYKDALPAGLSPSAAVIPLSLLLSMLLLIVLERPLRRVREGLLKQRPS